MIARHPTWPVCVDLVPSVLCLLLVIFFVFSAALGMIATQEKLNLIVVWVMWLVKPSWNLAVLCLGTSMLENIAKDFLSLRRLPPTAHHGCHSSSVLTVKLGKTKELCFYASCHPMSFKVIQCVFYAFFSPSLEPASPGLFQKLGTACSLLELLANVLTQSAVLCLEER